MGMILDFIGTGTWDGIGLGRSSAEVTAALGESAIAARAVAR